MYSLEFSIYFLMISTSSNTKIGRKDYFLLILLVFLSGSPNLSQPLTYGILGVSALIYSFLRKDYKRRKILWYYLLFIAFLFILQYFVLGMVSFLGSLNFLAKITLGATILWMLKDKFRYAYFNVMYVVSCISLVFFGLFSVGVVIPDLFPTVPGRNSILIFTQQLGILRNSGPFWEPGAFACYLILIPILFIDDLHHLVKTHKIKCLILFFALVTTFSTTGFICFAVVCLYYLSMSKHKVFTYLIIIPLALVLMYDVYQSNDFLGEKLESQFESSQELEGDFSNSRMGSLMFDWHYIAKHPLVGNGLTEQTRYADHPYLWGVDVGNGNGFSNYMAQIGVLAMFFYLFLFAKTIGVRKYDKLMSLVILLLLLQGEQLLTYPLYSALPFAIINYRKKYESSLVVSN